MRPRLALVLVLTTACASKTDGGGNGDSTSPGPVGCTEIGCQDGLLVQVTPSSGWPAGQYTYAIELDDQTITCTGTLPLPACGSPGMTCDAEGVQITESGCALPPEEQAFGDVNVPTQPTAVSITIQHDGTEVASGSWTPEYETLQPNGPECEPTCSFASVELAASFP